MALLTSLLKSCNCDGHYPKPKKVFIEYIPDTQCTCIASSDLGDVDEYFYGICTEDSSEVSFDFLSHPVEDLEIVFKGGVRLPKAISFSPQWDALKSLSFSKTHLEPLNLKGCPRLQKLVLLDIVPVSEKFGIHSASLTDIMISFEEPEARTFLKLCEFKIITKSLNILKFLGPWPMIIKSVNMSKQVHVSLDLRPVQRIDKIYIEKCMDMLRKFTLVSHMTLSSSTLESLSFNETWFTKHHRRFQYLEDLNISFVGESITVEPFIVTAFQNGKTKFKISLLTHGHQGD